MINRIAIAAIASRKLLMGNDIVKSQYTPVEMRSSAVHAISTYETRRAIA